MGELPTGTITMLFSDIERSTALLSRLGDRYADALTAQRAFLRTAIAARHGREMGTEGDSFFVVFGSAADAVCCCVAAQQSLYRYDWPGGVPVRVRMGLHTGEPSRHEDGYIGLDVHRAARIAATAHGGQVVLSDATRLLAEPRLPPGVSVRDLGWHRLKDIDSPERIYQLHCDGLPDRFPPLRSLGAPTSLPMPATPLVGRDSELEQLCAALSRPEVRLVTLTGPGGVGKTRLALAVAASTDRAFPHGVFFVALASVLDAGVMWKAIASSLDVTGDRAAAEEVSDYLSDRHALLVLDNLEQLQGAAGVVAELLAAAPGLVIVATSRRPLHLQGEYEQPVPPLEIPLGAGVEGVAASAAVRLFVQHARLVKPGFAVTTDNARDIAAICQRLDGLPLAIELAAARVRLLAPRALLARLHSSLGLAATDAGRPSRQQTLRHTIAWSYDLLEPELARVFRRMGVFAGGCDLDALAAVAADPGGAAADPLQLAEQLLDASLVTVTEGADGEPRIGVLETIREYAVERLNQAGELEDTRRWHAGHYARLAEQARQQIFGPAHLTFLDQLDVEHDNLHAALSWTLDAPAPAADGSERLRDERAATGLRLVQALAPFWYKRGHALEGRRWLERAVVLAASDAGAPLAEVAHWLAVLLLQQDQVEVALPLLDRSLALWRDLGHREHQARELNSLGITRSRVGDLAAARSLLEESVAICREVGNGRRLAAALTNLGQTESLAGNLDRATQVLQEALALDQQRADAYGVAMDQQSLAVVSLRAGRVREASDLVSTMLDYVIGSGDTEFVASALELSACIAAADLDCPRAARLAGAVEALRQRAGMPVPAPDAALLELFLAPARAACAPQAWEAELAAGRELTEQEAATLMRSACPGHHREDS
jgi:predicted ATPase/class 3 adenylate cyclase